MSLPPQLSPPPRRASVPFVAAGVAFLCLVGLGLAAFRARHDAGVQTLSQSAAGETWLLFDDAHRFALPVAPAQDLNESATVPLRKFIAAGGVMFVNTVASYPYTPPDTFAENELHTSGRIFLVEAGTPCQVRQVNAGAGVALVQIMGGVHAGESGIVVLAMVQRRAQDRRVFVRFDRKPTINDLCGSDGSQWRFDSAAVAQSLGDYP